MGERRGVTAGTNWGGNVWVRVVRTPIGAVSAALVVVMVLLAALGPVIFGADASDTDTEAILTAPSRHHILGTDNLGRDILLRVLVATRTSLISALIAIVIAIAAGVFIGVCCALLKQRASAFAGAIISLLVAFPPLLLIVFAAVIFGVGEWGAILAIAVGDIPFYARIVFNLAKETSGKEFIWAARVLGVKRWRVALRHVLPNIGEHIAVTGAIGAGGALVLFSALSFLGLGIQPPEYDWGSMLTGGVLAIYQNPGGALGPAVAIIIGALAFNLLGETGARVLNGSGRAVPVGPRPLGVGRNRRFREAVDPARATDEIVSRPAGSPIPLLSVRDLTVWFPQAGQWVPTVRDVGFDVAHGEAVGVVGESGSGKSVTAMAVSRLLGGASVWRTSRLLFDGRDVSQRLSRATRRRLALELASVFQDPSTSLNPTARVGDQLTEVSRIHEGMTRQESRARAVDRLRAVKISAPERRMRQFPHEFSGGMRQRAMIAMALMGTPKLIVADEPTTALDVTVQREVLGLLNEARKSRELSVLLISHDITVITDNCDRVLVMYAGRIVEECAAEELNNDALHPYTRMLVRAVPTMAADRSRELETIPGRPPEARDYPPGCAFAARCPLATDRCISEDPDLTDTGHGHRVACWHPGRGPVETAGAEGRVQAATSSEDV